MNKNINFAKPLLILKKRKHCIQPYNRHKSIYLFQEHIKNKTKLKRHLSQVSREWAEGTYLLKAYVKDCNAIFQPTCTIAEVKVAGSKPDVTLSMV